jgi:hypothetical protein
MAHFQPRGWETTMNHLTSAAIRSGIATLAVCILFIAAHFTLLSNPNDAHRLEAALRAAGHPTTLISAAIGWMAFSGWLWMENREPPPVPPSRIVRIGSAVLTTLLVSAGIVVLLECVQAISNGFSIIYSWGIPWRYWLRLFEAALFAVVLVRISLPLLPRFARMPPHNP